MVSLCGGKSGALTTLREGVEELSPNLTSAFLPPNYRFARAAVPGQGSCFFNSFLYLTEPESYCHLTMRDKEKRGRECRAAFSKLLDSKWFDWIRKFDPQREYPEFHDSRLEVIKQWFKDPKTWANTVIIKFVSEHMKVDIVFIDSEAKALFCGILPDKGEPARRTIVIMWVQREHFEPVFLMYPPPEYVAGKSQKVKMLIKTDFDPANEEDAKIIGALRSNFRDTCSPTLRV
jgi:hypothetical protein